MKAKEFRTLALALPETSEESHQGHPDFRVAGKIFATLGPDEDWAMVKLTVDEQALVTHADPSSFAPVNGAWGRQGCTRIELASAKKSTVERALLVAWCKTAPKKLAKKHGLGEA